MSRTIAIVTDSTSDLPPEIQRQFGISVIPLNVHFGQETLRDGVDLSADEFMEKLGTSDKLPTTSHPAVSVFEAAFRSLAETHDTILCVLLSSKLSGTVQSARLAAGSVADTIAVEVVDSLNVAYALGFQAIRAAKLADEAIPLADIVTTLSAEIDQYHIVFFVETLEHLRRGGRIGKAAQLLGSLLQLKPLLRVEEGQVVPFERSRTRSKATAALIDFARELNDIEQVAVLYNTTPDDARELAGTLGKLLDMETVPVVHIGPVISTDVGPGVLGIVVKEAPGD
ncbi:MAG: DegV family protein [Chloroflexota bacterium]|nr:DegV family protein [Chloroflexota bacterium]